MKPYIYLHQVQKEYLIRGQIPVVALRGIDLSVSQGEMIAVCGVSGSGKSTLLHIIGCLDKPTTGEYYLDDCNIGELKDAGLSKIRNRKIGFVLQDFGLIPYRTALENVSVPLTFSSRPGSEIKKRSMAALENMGIADLAKRKVSQMSGGQKQRVALARALVNDPDIILADEPTGALDSKTKIEILDLFKSIHDTGKTIIIVTHDSELAAITDRALHMTDGLIV